MNPSQALFFPSFLAGTQFSTFGDWGEVLAEHKVISFCGFDFDFLGSPTKCLLDILF